MIDALEKYVLSYMQGLIDRGYRRQFFNIEIWGHNKKDENGEDDIDFCFCEINPRCAHAYHIPYQIAYGTNLWGDNFNLVLENKAPTETPWSKWRAGENKVSVQVLINIMGLEGKKVKDILNYDLIDFLEKENKVELIRHVKNREYVITKDDAESGAGCTLLQIFQKCSTHEEAAAMEMAIRNIVYKPECVQGDEYPAFWPALAAKYGVPKAETKLQSGFDTWVNEESKGVAIPD